MKKIYNIFFYFNNEVCSQVSYATHESDDDDEAAIQHLLKTVNVDFATATVLRLKKTFTRAELTANQRLAQGNFLIEQLFNEIGAERSPLCVITPVVDGVPYVDHRVSSKPLDINELAAKNGAKGHMTDWLIKYKTPAGLDLPKLIHDDYFLAMKLLFNKRLYVSAMKLLVSCIDSVAYIEYGDIPKENVFVKWLDTYAQLSLLGITSSELWEMRNGILHMTNLNSKKVMNSKVRRISFRVGGDIIYATSEAGVYYFEFKQLIDEFAQSLSRWISTYNDERSKFSKFVERYDQTISDSRFAIDQRGHP